LYVNARFTFFPPDARDVRVRVTRAAKGRSRVTHQMKRNKATRKNHTPPAAPFTTPADTPADLAMIDAIDHSAVVVDDQTVRDYADAQPYVNEMDAADSDADLIDATAADDRYLAEIDAPDRNNPAPEAREVAVEVVAEPEATPEATPETNNDDDDDAAPANVIVALGSPVSEPALENDAVALYVTKIDKRTRYIVHFKAAGIHKVYRTSKRARARIEKYLATGIVPMLKRG
jgi:hypothetical protein